MRYKLGRSGVISTCALLTALVTACSAGGGGDGANGEPGASTIDADAAKEAMAHPDMSALDGLSHVSGEEMLGSEKIRNGQLINYTHQVGNGTVGIVASTPQGPFLCTAQVVNKWFLLTAAHCAAVMFPSGSGNIAVGFTNSSGAANTIYSGPVAAGVIPNARREDRDVAVVVLLNGMNTCQLTLADCAASQPNIPVNAGFQYFRPDLPVFKGTSYTAIGYGATDNGSTGAGRMRRGTMPASSVDFRPDDGFALTLTWSGLFAPRGCGGDSGGPLVVPISAVRPFYTGFASKVPGDSCVANSGSVIYSGLTDSQGAWALSQILSIRNAFSLGFDCSAGTADNLSLFACDNDGTVF